MRWPLQWSPSRPKWPKCVYGAKPDSFSGDPNDPLYECGEECYPNDHNVWVIHKNIILNIL